MEKPKTLKLLVDGDGQWFVIEALSPAVYPLGIHFAVEALCWEHQVEKVKIISLLAVENE